ncbi:protein kinase domain containing protein [Nitzschia inconspicua]|uniref:Protein kinase domain containing protein n=1 Tax=Nitzschia inconspicua TaxID=303405 RepID=A0A9K3M5K3_9STRA|nr:protein kinase domain containing protein [Nitzschia inconspicua]
MEQFLKETTDLPLQQQIDRFNQWLHENPHHVNYSTVQWLLDEKQQHAQQLAEKDQKLAEKDQQDQQLAQRLAQLDQRIAERKQQIAEGKRKLAAVSLQSLKKQYLALTDRTISGPHLSKRHKHAEVRQIDDLVDCLHHLERNWLDDQFWQTGYVPHGQFNSCHHESEVQGSVVYLLQTLIVALNLSDYIDIVQNITLAGSECDILLVYRPNDLPFAVMEVKKPCNSQANRRNLWHGVKQSNGRKGQNVVAGQIFDSMSAIQLFGFPNLYGMITTGNHWRLVGTYSDEDPGDRDNLDELLLTQIKEDTSSNETVAGVLKQFREMMDTGSSGCSDKDSPEQPSVVVRSKAGNRRKHKVANRFVWASKIVPSFEESMNEDEVIAQVKESGVQIVSLIVLFVVKGCQVLTEFLKNNGVSPSFPPSITFRPKMPCRILETNEPKFTFGSIIVDSLNLNEYKVEPLPKRLFVIQHLGFGGSGNCCLALSDKGESCCAIKFFHRARDRDIRAVEECSNWNKVYGKANVVPKCRVFEAAEGYCLVMPYFRPILEADRRKMLENGSIKKALEQFASSGFIHCDIKWCHLAFWKEDIVLLDLGMIKEEEDEGERSIWCTKALEKLQKKLQLQNAEKAPRTQGTKRKH